MTTQAESGTSSSSIKQYQLFQQQKAVRRYLFAKIVKQTLLFYKGLLILQAIIKALADDEKNIPAFSEKKKKQARFQIKNGNR
jgi:hypothetical protein